jgi:hypothetical protein
MHAVDEMSHELFSYRLASVDGQSWINSKVDTCEMRHDNWGVTWTIGILLYRPKKLNHAGRESCHAL